MSAPIIKLNFNPWGIIDAYPGWVNPGVDIWPMIQGWYIGALQESEMILIWNIPDGVQSVSATGLPPGISVNNLVGGPAWILSNNRTWLNGIPTTAGIYNVAFSATNSDGTTTVNFTMIVHAAPPPVIYISPNSTEGNTLHMMEGWPYVWGLFRTLAVGSKYNNSLPGMGIPDPFWAFGRPQRGPFYNCYGLFLDNRGNDVMPMVGASSTVLSASPGLPDGITWDGYLQGTPTTPGTYPIRVTATNDYGTDTMDVVIVVDAFVAFPVPTVTQPWPRWTTVWYFVVNNPIPTGLTVTASFIAPVFQAGGVANTNIFSADGLPDGLTIDAATGALSGTPTNTGIYKVTFYAANVSGTGSCTTFIAVGGNFIWTGCNNEGSLSVRLVGTILRLVYHPRITNGDDVIIDLSVDTGLALIKHKIKSASLVFKIPGLGTGKIYKPTVREKFKPSKSGTGGIGLGGRGAWPL